MSDEIDLGHEHIMRFIQWAPDDLPANRERFGYPLPHVEKAGISIRHQRLDGGGECVGIVIFDLPDTGAMGYGDHTWKVESLEPLTISPSVLCRRCGDHGFIRNGRWEVA